MRSLVIFFSGWIFSGLSAQVHRSSLEIFPLNSDCYVFTTYGDPGDGSKYPANGMYVLTDKGVVMIDTPWDSTQYQPLLDSIYARHHQRVVLSIATHFHADRTAGLAYYKTKGIKTYSSKLTYDLCKKKNEPQAQYYFTQDTAFKVGHTHIATYYPGQGHAPDNIVVWIDQYKVLFGGCFVKSTETAQIGNLSDANVPIWKNSIQKVIKKYPRAKYVIPGHLGWANSGLNHTLDIVTQYIVRSQ
jgi:glyoxylase-like metal-dependent hydrolase (beta-lactamase superfamily II)